MADKIRETLVTKLRIAWSVACGLVAVLLIVVWAVSYTFWNGLWIRYSNTPDRSLHIFTERGRLTVQTRWNTGLASFLYEHARLTDALGQAPDDDARTARDERFHILHWHGRPIYIIRLWFTCLFASGSVILPWFHLPTRFSVRTLLIGTTLVAALLGLIAWLAR
jgi:uncharacterized membrane protein